MHACRVAKARMGPVARQEVSREIRLCRSRKACRRWSAAASPGPGCDGCWWSRASDKITAQKCPDPLHVAGVGRPSQLAPRAMPPELGRCNLRFVGVDDLDPDASSDRLFALVHGGKAGRRERIPAVESFFHQQLLVCHALQCCLVLLKVGAVEAQHLAWSHEEPPERPQHSLFRCR